MKSFIIAVLAGVFACVFSACNGTYGNQSNASYCPPGSRCTASRGALIGQNHQTAVQTNNINFRLADIHLHGVGGGQMGCGPQMMRRPIAMPHRQYRPQYQGGNYCPPGYGGEYGGGAPMGIRAQWQGWGAAMRPKGPEEVMFLQHHGTLGY